MTNNTQKPVEEIELSIPYYRVWQPDLINTVVNIEHFMEVRDFYRELWVSERQEAEKLRQENEALKAQVAQLDKACESFKNGMMDAQDKACLFHIQENEALRAQVDGLAERLNDSKSLIKFVKSDDLTPIAISYQAEDLITRIDKALSTLPSTFLEIQKAKDKYHEELNKLSLSVRKFADNKAHSFSDNETSDLFWKMCEANDSSEEALRTLQQAQEKV